MIDTLHLFEPLDDQLLALLRSLSRQDWSRPTIAGAWTVRDVAAHLLDTPLRRLSFVRDGWPPDVEIRSDADLVRLVNAMNAEGVRTYGRLSPAILIDLLALAATQLRGHLRASALEAAAAFPVSWAGESTSAHWFDVAREYTERWHHQAQIRLAVGALDAGDDRAVLRAGRRHVHACRAACLPVARCRGRHACRYSRRRRRRRAVDDDARRGDVAPDAVVGGHRGTAPLPRRR